MSTTQTAPVRSEDILSAKTDLCISNAIVKAGVGFGAGVVASAILFRRRPWPVLLGLGFGFGQGYSDCERVFNPAAVPGFRIQGEEGKKSPYSNFNPFAGASKQAEAGGAATATSTSAAPAPSTAELKNQAKATKDAVVEKAKDVKDAVVGGAKKAEAKVESAVDEKVKTGPKWV